MTRIVDRRTWLVGLAAGALAARTAPVLAQESPARSFSEGVFIEAISDPLAIESDVLFVQSWRFLLAPRGYESDGDYRQAFLQHFREIFPPLYGQGVEFVLSRMEERGVDLTDTASVLDSRFAENIGEFDRFMDGIGVRLSEPAGSRILSSLFYYAQLNFILAENPAAAEERSFMWPFC